jgi:hypothetical protein
MREGNGESAVDAEGAAARDQQATAPAAAAVPATGGQGKAPAASAAAGAVNCVL